MFFLKKLFQLRDKANPDLEKPFLEHLEDLRIAISRIIFTLLVATIACFVLRDHLMAILRRPVEQVWVSSQTDRLPARMQLARPLTLESWEQAKRVADAIAPLPPATRAACFDQSADPDLRFHVEALLLYRAALQLPEAGRLPFLAQATAAAPPERPPTADHQPDPFLTAHGPALRQQVAALLESGPDPLIDDREDLRMMGAFNPTEAFMLSIKLAFFAGIVISFPLLLFFILQFVLPGLHRNEKRALWPALAIGFGLFLTGVLFAYYAVLPRVLEFFHQYAKDMGIANEWRIGYYISFATQFTLIFGLGFELPVVVMTLVKLGILGWETMRHTRAYAILAIVVIAAIITPTPDAFTLGLLAVPMVILYEICIWLAWWIHRRDQRAEAAEAAAEQARLHEHPHATTTEEDEQEDTGNPQPPPPSPDIDPFTDYPAPESQPESQPESAPESQPEPAPESQSEPEQPVQSDPSVSSDPSDQSDPSDPAE